MLGSLIGAAASLFGGQSAQKAAEKQNAQQRDLALNSVSYRVADANRAGIHPLYAMGAPTIGSSVTSVGDGGIAAAGQNLARAFDAQSTRPERNSHTAALAGLTTERASLENELLRTQIATSRMALTRQPGNPPPIGVPSDPSMIDGQMDSGMRMLLSTQGSQYKEKPMERSTTMPGAPYAEAAPVSEIGYTRTSDGGWAPVPSKDAKDRIEDMTFPEISWAIRNNLMPTIGYNKAPPPNVPLKPGYHWVYSTLSQAYYQVPHNRYPGQRYEHETPKIFPSQSQ